MLPRPQRGSISRSCRRAPSDSARSTSSDPAVPPTRRDRPLSGDRDPPPRAIAHRPTRPPTRTGPPLRPRCEPPSQRGRALFRAAAGAHASCASAHVSWVRISVIGSVRSSDSSPVAGERRQSIPPHPLRRHLSVPSHSSSTATFFFGHPQAASRPSPPSRPTPAARRRPSRPTSPPSFDEEVASFRAPSPPQATGLDFFSEPDAGRRSSGRRVGYGPPP